MLIIILERNLRALASAKILDIFLTLSPFLTLEKSKEKLALATAGPRGLDTEAQEANGQNQMESYGNGH